METRLEPREAITAMEHQSKAMELLDRYGTSRFVDAVEASRFNRVFRKRFNVSLSDDESFWDDVQTSLTERSSTASEPDNEVSPAK